MGDAKEKAVLAGRDRVGKKHSFGNFNRHDYCRTFRQFGIAHPRLEVTLKNRKRGPRAMPEVSFEVFQCHLKKNGGLGQIADRVQAVIFLPFLFLKHFLPFLFLRHLLFSTQRAGNRPLPSRSGRAGNRTREVSRLKTKTGGKLQRALYQQFRLSHPFEVTLKSLKRDRVRAFISFFQATSRAGGQC